MTDLELKNIINEYKKLKKEHPDLHIEYCLQQNSLEDTIKIAAQSVNHLNKIHPHQHRVGRKKLNKFANELVNHVSEFEKANNFDNVYNIISKVNMHGIGALTCYDTALRICSKISYKNNFFPDKIYLHAGTRIGAKKLIGNKKLKGKQFIYKNDLPDVLKNSELTPSELEDILCCFIAKGEFCSCLSEKAEIF